MNQSTMRANARNAVKDLDSGAYAWTDNEVDAAVTRAYAEYGAAACVLSYVDKNGDGSTRDFDCSAATGISYVVAVEHPVGEDPQAYLPFREWQKGKVRVVGDPPASGTGNVRAWYAQALDVTANPWLSPADDDGIVEVGAVAYLLLSGARYQAARVSASAATPANLETLGRRALAEFRAELERVRARPLPVGYVPVWGREDRGEV